MTSRTLPYLALLLLATISVAHGQKAIARDASLAGVVTGVTGTPVILHLEIVSDDPLQYYDGYQVTAAADGKFRFDHIRPGTYKLSALAAGFMPQPAQPSAATTFTLAAGENRKAIAIAMAHKRVLCGHLTGTPPPKAAQVAAYRYLPEFDTLAEAATVTIDDNGRFRFADLEPGRYYLEAPDQSWYTGQKDTPPRGWTNFVDAQSVAVDASADSSCTLDIPLLSVSCKAVNISGRIGGDATSAPLYYIFFLQRNPAGGRYQTWANTDKPQYYGGDTFHASLCPGEYDVVLSTDQQYLPWRGLPHTRVLRQTAHLTVGETDVSDLALTPEQTATISGEIRFTDPAHGANCPSSAQHVSLLRQGDGQMQTTGWDNKLHFTFKNVVPGKFTIYLGPFLREAIYAESITVDGVATQGRALEITQAKPVSVIITLSNDRTKAAGHILADVRREPRWEVAWTRPKATVTGQLLNTDGRIYSVHLRSARYNSNASADYVVASTPDGKFSFETVDPGVYTLRAQIPTTVPMEYGAAAPGQQGKPLILRPGDHLTGLNITPPHPSAICGQILDSDGIPRPFTSVNLLYDRFGQQGSLQDPTSRTDANGEFRLESVTPGDYFLMAFPYNHALFFSSDNSLAQALPVHIEAGRSIGCPPDPPLQAHVPRDAGKSFAVSGTLQGDLPAIANYTYTASLSQANPNGVHYQFAYAQIDDKQHFHFSGVPDGHFELTVRGAATRAVNMGSYSHVVAQQTIQVHGQDVTSLSVPLQQLPMITGHITFGNVSDTWKRNLQPSLRDIRFQQKHPGGAFYSYSPVAADGTFTAGPFDVSDYKFELSIPGGQSSQIVRVNGQEIHGEYFHLAAAASATLEIELSEAHPNNDSAHVTVELLPDDKLPKPEPSVPESCQCQIVPQYTTILIADPPFPPAADPTAIPTAHVVSSMGGGLDADGIWQQSVTAPPGKYRILLLQGFRAGFYSDKRSYSDQQWWNALAALGQAITLEPHAQLPIILPDKTLEVTDLAWRLHAPLAESHTPTF